MDNIIIKLSGEIQSSNFNEWQEIFYDELKSFKQELETDNDFAQAVKNIKWCKSAEKALKSAKESAIRQASDIEQLFDEIDEVISQARETRLKLNKQVKNQKEEIKDKVAIEGVVRMTELLAQQSDDFNLLDNSMFTNKENFLSAISGSRGITGAKERVNTLCLNYGNQISQRASEVQNKATIIDSQAFGYSALFQDRGYLLGLQLDDLNREIDSRIATYTANQERMNTKPITEDAESIETDEETVSDDEEIAHRNFLSIAETKVIISKLLQEHDDDDIIMALKTCLRLLEEEIGRSEKESISSENGIVIKENHQLDRQSDSFQMNLRAFEKKGVKSFWYIASIQNLESISKKGILSHNEVRDLGINHFDISDHGVQRRRNIEHTGMDLQNMVPLYINPKNAMLFVLREQNNNLCLLEIDPWVLATCPLNFSDGNAANAATKFYQEIEDLDKLSWDILFSERWNEFTGGKRKRMAEVLIDRSIHAKYILGYHFYSATEAKRFKEQNNHCSVYVSIDKFFE